MYELKQNFVSADKYHLKCPHAMQPTTITIHNTGNTASAYNESQYMKNNKNFTSFHVVIDDQAVIECIPFDRNAWHAGDGENGPGNRTSISIEIAYSMDFTTNKYILAEANAVIYVASLLKQYGWGIDNLRQHFDWNGKNCPHRLREGDNWQRFLKQIANQLNQKTDSLDQKTDSPASANDWGAEHIGKTYGQEHVMDAYLEIGGPSWYTFNNVPHPLSIYPDIASALEDKNADPTIFIENDDAIEYWGVVLTNKHSYLVYTRDNGQQGVVSIKNKTKNSTYGFTI